MFCLLQVLVRLKTLIRLQKMIAKYLPQMLIRDYCPPKCNFHKSVKIPIIGSDKKRKYVNLRVYLQNIKYNIDFLF